MAHEAGTHSNDMTAHVRTYENFLRGSVALALSCAFVLVALTMFAFGKSMAVFWGFAGLGFGLAMVAIDTISGSRTWMLSLGFLILFGLFTAVRIS
jgi:hypothetical protein